MVGSLIGLAVAVFGFAAMRDPMRLNLNPLSPSAKGYYQRMVLDTTMRIKITPDGVDVQTREEVLPSGDLNLRCGTEQLLRFDNAGMGSDEEGTYECGAWHIDDIPFAERTALHVEAALQWREQQITNTYGKE
jgi:hypothetical protein